MTLVKVLPDVWWRMARDLIVALQTPLRRDREVSEEIF